MKRFHRKFATQKQQGQSKGQSQNQKKSGAVLQGRRLKDMGGEKMPPPIEMCNPKLKLPNRLNDWYGLKNMGLATP